MRFLSALLLILCFVSCAGHRNPVQVPSAQEFGVPSELANKFEVKENGNGTQVTAVPAPESVVPAPESVVPAVPVLKADPKADKKKGKNAKGAKGAKTPAKVEAPAPVADRWPNRWTMPNFFRPGERYVFDITYFGATAGQLQLELLPDKVVANRPVHHIRATATTSSVFSLFYRLQDVAESYMDNTALFSHKFVLKLDESLQQRDVLELYDQKKHTVYYWSKLDHKKKGKIQDQFEIPTEPYTQDGISAFYFLRTLPLEIGKAYDFPVVTNGKLRNVRVTAIRKENLVTKIGERPTIVVKPEVVLDGVLKPYGDSFVWISDDDERLILKIDAKIKVGSIIAYLREHGYGTAPAPVQP